MLNRWRRWRIRVNMGRLEDLDLKLGFFRGRRDMNTGDFLVRSALLRKTYEVERRIAWLLVSLPGSFPCAKAPDE